jgi:hypothetical protein
VAEARHGDSSGTQKKGNVCRRKSLPEDIGEDLANSEDLVLVVVKCTQCRFMNGCYL